jgi:hypothetical protein
VADRIAGLALAVTLVAGCKFTPGQTVDGGGDDGVADGRLDAPENGDGPCWSYGPRYFDPCANNPSGSPIDLSLAGTYVYNTDDGTLIDPTGTAMSMPTSTVTSTLRIWWTQRFDIRTPATLRAIGSLPLMIVSTSTIAIAGGIDVHSYWDAPMNNFSRGAGANDPSCPPAPPDVGTQCEHGGAGGGGGGLGATGGLSGGGGFTHDCPGFPMGQGVPGSAGGNQLGDPTRPMGGCAGNDGGFGNGDVDDRGLGGPGGGAIHLVAFSSADISGTLHAGGAGGRSGLAGRSGGGGGGTGGFIGIEATSIAISGVIAANGGGGGGGCNGAFDSQGIDGQPSVIAAEGGPPEGNSGAGGDGGYGLVPAGQPGIDAPDRGGGGGGGGVGFVLLLSGNTQISGGMVTPAPL